jgi:tRNA(fMet)-specific endonuclease VapC
VIYLFDTNAVIALLNRQPPQISEKLILAEGAGHMIVFSSIALHELWFGVGKSDRATENAQRLRRLLQDDFKVLSLDEEDAEIAGRLRAELKKIGKPIGPYDFLIAAQALRHGATLITANVKEFARVPGLKWENWAN